MLWILLLFLHGPVEEPNAGAAFEARLDAGRFSDRGHSIIRYNFDHYSLPPTIHVYPRLGCALLFERPFHDTWASDVRGQGTGKFYHYTPWGNADDGASKMIVAAKLETSDPVNLFFLFGDQVMEILLVQVAEAEQADRLVRFSFEGGREQRTDLLPEPKKSPAITKPNPAPEWTQLFHREHRRKRLKHGTVAYNFDEPAFFLAFEPRPTTPPIVALEVVRATPRRFRKGFKLEYPLAETRRHVSETGQLLFFPNVALEPRENLYLRIQVAGERDARFHKLKVRR